MYTHIPNKMTSSHHNLPWFNLSLRCKSRTKQRLYNKAKKSGNPTHWHQFRVARHLHQSLKSARGTYVSDYLGEAIEENPKRFWTYIKQLKKEDLEIDGEVIIDGTRKSDILNKQFSYVFTEENLTNIPSVGNDPKPGIRSLQISIAGVTKQLTSLKINKACGPDNIPAWFLKEYAHEILPILADIYQYSIDTAIVPSKWKIANICAIFKKRGEIRPNKLQTNISNLYCFEDIRTYH